MPVIRVSPDTYNKLVELQGKLQSMLGKKISMGDVVSFLVNRSAMSVITEEDAEYLIKVRDTDKRKYAKALLINYAILNHLSWNEVNGVLREKCGAGVEEADKAQLDCVVSFLESELKGRLG